MPFWNSAHSLKCCILNRCICKWACFCDITERTQDLSAPYVSDIASRTGEYIFCSETVFKHIKIEVSINTGPLKHRSEILQLCVEFGDTAVAAAPAPPEGRNVFRKPTVRWSNTFQAVAEWSIEGSRRGVRGHACKGLQSFLGCCWGGSAWIMHVGTRNFNNDVRSWTLEWAPQWASNLRNWHFSRCFIYMHTHIYTYETLFSYCLSIV